MTAKPFIRPAEFRDIDSICELLHTRMNRKIEPNRWRNLMTYHWLADKPDLGRVVEDNGEILGYLGMLYSDRTVNQHRERVVNICAWYLDKSLRGLGLGKSIMANATSDPSLSYTIMTSSKNTVEILDEVGYEILDFERYIWRKNADQESPINVITDIEKIYLESSSLEKKLLDDHCEFPVTPVLAKYEGRQCILFFSIKQKGENVTYFDVLFTSDRVFLGEFGQRLANVLLPERAAVLAVDRRFASKVTSDVDVEKLPVPRFFKSSRLQRKDFDHLYTELQLLDLKLD